MLSSHASLPLSTSLLAALLALQSMLLSIAAYAAVFTSQSVSLLFVVSQAISLILSFSAAGNDDVDASNDSPARVAAAITVGALKFSTRSSYFQSANANTPGALNADNSKADFSNFGRPLDGASPLTTPNSCPS